MRKYTTDKIIKLLDTMISTGNTDDDLSTLINLINVTNNCLVLIYDMAEYRTSPYEENRKVGECAYSSILNWQRLLSDWRDSL